MSGTVLHVEGRVLEDDAWIQVADDAALPEGPVLVSHARWQADREVLLARAAPVGVVLGPDEPVDALAADLPHLACIALHFPGPGEGRPYSAARLLRGRYAYRGELRAVGAVLIDQAHFLKRSGFDVLALRADQDVPAALAALRTFSVHYQPGADEPLPLYRRRAAS
ncbi:DUF934 domain-containing protein [Candidatus Macondimonas diazotrophica]|jgi:uncharacterized protein (DUF934 family)|uniref:DUF934 domain-containing protein n=1 Tax=Candidatus Macondimonas diazotrophica TaxID=2305248 RepID=A0A4Z0FA56_9GAMM|nr:DUF934 domain-containing protein [Candidatus Macondimonas diazotrophica]NCU01298.1 DUF934 domain-containing protein [Candidatus Macondimonas diazotrophica]TFZ83319.1 DUF934 domain-containing protein [Candidatus Macondimonas diazotrophica]